MSPLIWQINKFNPYLFQNNVDKTTSVKVNSLKTRMNFFTELETWNNGYLRRRSFALWILTVTIRVSICLSKSDIRDFCILNGIQIFKERLPCTSWQKKQVFLLWLSKVMIFLRLSTGKNWAWACITRYQNIRELIHLIKHTVNKL